ncbi:hypothetical protein [Piscirickettsia salmonis]|nr:hypothetical protein [Piscirickettsia salmonis]
MNMNSLLSVALQMTEGELLLRSISYLMLNLVQKKEISLKF